MLSQNKQAFLKGLTPLPGVYQMLDSQQTILYVGKAKNLKKRISSYFRSDVSPKTQALMKQVEDIRVIITHTENEALILEYNLIKQYRPKYNILFRDDKSYPYIRLTKDKYPRLEFYRGARGLPGTYFGPYPSSLAVRDTLNLMQKVFLLRSCENSFFQNRSRPCLQYQIKRCSAPCVGHISQENYFNDVEHAVGFLRGNREEVIEDLEQKMQKAAVQLNYEAAAKIRDQIAQIRAIQAKQYVIHGHRNIDVIEMASDHGKLCLCLLLIRDGQILGNKVFFPEMQAAFDESEIIAQFVMQYYFSHLDACPQLIISSEKLNDQASLEQVISKAADQNIQIKQVRSKVEKNWSLMAKKSAMQALASKLTQQNNWILKFNSLKNLLNIPGDLERIECFDISHTSGEATVASCVVFGADGAIKSDYRHFNIENVTASDDYAAMQQVLQRRYHRIKTENGVVPDLIMIDGGKGQLHIAEKVLEELQINSVMILAVAKGKTRKPGFETLLLSGVERPLSVSPDHPGLHVLQQIRDEAHRFAITHNRQRVSKKRTQSRLENIEGIGAKRRKALLQYFGGLQAVEQASVEQLARVPGISEEVAQRIYDALHN